MQQFCEPWSGKLVRQNFGEVTFEYDLHFGHSRDRWKGLAKYYNSEKGQKN